MGKKLSSDEMLTAVLSYLSILVLIPYFMTEKKRNDFIRFHLKQGLALFIAEIIIWVVDFILGYIPYIGGLLSILLSILNLVLVIISIIALIKAISGEKWKIPILSDFSKNINIK